MPDESKPRYQVNISMPHETAKRLWTQALRLERKPGEYARIALDEKLDRDEKPAAKRKGKA